MDKSPPLRVRASGPLACFTRPEMKVERMSYEVMTPSAARGILEAILWKPAIRWHVHAIHVLAPIRWISFRRNEVNLTASPRMGDYFADEDRAQRNTVALRDVDYVIDASFSLTKRAGAQDTIGKFVDMFTRRLAKGQWFHHPYLGCREFAADVRPATDSFRAIDLGVDRPLGLVFYDFDYPDAKGAAQPRFFNARLDSGVLRIPSRDDLLAAEASS